MAGQCRMLSRLDDMGDVYNTTSKMERVCMGSASEELYNWMEYYQKNLSWCILDSFICIREQKLVIEARKAYYEGCFLLIFHYWNGNAIFEVRWYKLDRVISIPRQKWSLIKEREPLKDAILSRWFLIWLFEHFKKCKTKSYAPDRLFFTS